MLTFQLSSVTLHYAYNPCSLDCLIYRPLRQVLVSHLGNMSLTLFKALLFNNSKGGKYNPSRSSSPQNIAKEKPVLHPMCNTAAQRERGKS